MTQARFHDRRAAGRELAALLDFYQGTDSLVLGLPRGGVPVAAEVASALGAELDVYLVRKLGVPGHEELAFGAIAGGGIRVLNAEVIADARLSPAIIEAVTARERTELARREALYRAGRPPLRLSGRTVILVDDGLATGSTMRAAVQAARVEAPARLVVAVPVAARATCEELALVADDVVCVRMPEPFYAVGLWYADFSETSDNEVRDLLAGPQR